MEAFERTIKKFAAIAETLELPFHLTGGSISSAYGEPRLTQDIDIVVSPEIAKKRLDDLVSRLASSDFLFTETVVRRAVQSDDLFQLLDRSESLKLVIYPRELIPGELQRSQTLELFEGVFLPVVSRTDAAVSKLIWIDKGSQRSRRDGRSNDQQLGIGRRACRRDWHWSAPIGTPAAWGVPGRIRKIAMAGQPTPTVIP